METGRKNDLTPTQQRAVAARGNVLVMAGAGTGKTHTLVERCLDLICGEKISLDEILIVTFTEMAAMEMRERLRTALENATEERGIAEQLALFDAAHIGTLHSFCFKLVREHFHELGLDPQLSVLDEGQARLLMDETLAEQFEAHYENEDTFSLAVQELIRIYGKGRDEKIRALILKLHHYVQTRADAEAWLARQIENFSSTEPTQWREWFSEAVTNWRNEWLPVLRDLKGENIKAGECLEILETFSGGKASTHSLFKKLAGADSNYPPKKKTVLRKPLEDFFEDAEFLGSLAAEGKTEPLAEDWGWVRGHMKTLLLLAKEFSEKFSARKRSDGAVDFHDLEQFAIQLLWDSRANKPTEIAKRWREKLRYIFVDEYQDINAAQDRIISALSRDNRFLVGDVKQSIYRFRLANPQIFQDYARNPQAWKGQTIALAENFRSREGLLHFINSLFAPLMREDVGGVHYDEQAKLKFGSPETRGELSLAQNREPRVELLLRAKQRGESSGGEVGDALGDLQESEKEARLVALRLLELKNSGHPIWDDGKFRAADWQDFAVLLRAPGTKAEIFAKQFERAGVPLLVERGGFYESSEIADLLSLLKLADNPLQDVPCIAVLRSPLVGCSMDELAEIRLAGPGHFWFALNHAANAKSKIQSGTRRKVETFLKRFSGWRRLAQQASLSQCLEAVLAETHYDVWLLSRPRGAQRRANVQRFLNLAEQFDAFQRQGLFRFLRFVDAQREIDAEPEVAPLAEENAVRLMSIHQSKGLEFPIVALADLGKKFNEQDLHGEIILDERFGLCPRVKPPSSGGRYPSLAYWLAQKNQRRELRGEELRLLYVALTRARDTLILSGGVSEKKWDGLFQKTASITPHDILSAGSDMDWLGLWFRMQNAESKIVDPRRGELPSLRWRFVDDAELAEPPAATDKTKAPLPSIDEATEKKLVKVLDWQYPHQTATKLAAKTSVTTLRRQAAEEDDEAEQKFSPHFTRKKTRNAGRTLSAEDTGVAHHKFLQHFSLDAAKDLKSFTAEARRLEKENYLSAEEAAALDMEALADFWGSPIGKRIRAQAASIRRELPFTASFGPDEINNIFGKDSPADLKGEFVVIQGVADLAVLMPKEIWLVDFKTDAAGAKELPDKIKIYSPQLRLYAQALEKIYSRPVTNCWLHFLAARKTVPIDQ
ncbi:MAG TPA: UvrD-helicase domain-containing protein [Pseudomonadales bacterium]|nr:UvrD-helicase domain-containing protein [Pseudomonadales bacterium]